MLVEGFELTSSAGPNALGGRKEWAMTIVRWEQILAAGQPPPQDATQERVAWLGPQALLGQMVPQERGDQVRLPSGWGAVS